MVINLFNSLKLSIINLIDCIELKIYIIVIIWLKGLILFNLSIIY